MGSEAIETTAISTMITREHGTIGEVFVNRVTDLLGSGRLKIKKYGVDIETYAEVEVIKFEVNEKTSLEISLKRYT